MAYVSILFSLGLAFFFFKATNNIYNAGTVFLGYWSVLIFLNKLALDNLYKVSEMTYTYIFLGLVGFAIGALGAIAKKRNDFGNKAGEPNYLLFKIACIIVIIYCLYRITIIITFITQGYSWGDIRMMNGIAGDSGSGTLKGGTYSQIIHEWFVAPIIYLLAPTLIVDIFLGKRDKKMFILSICAIILYSISTVSRAIWSFLILYSLCILIICRGKYQIPKKIKKWIKKIPIFVVLLFVIIIFITQQRSEDSEVKIFLNMYAYLAGGITLMDIHLHSFLANIHTFGLFSTYGFIQPIFFFLKIFKIMDYPQALLNVSTIKDNLEVFIPISDNITMNAYSTLFFNFYSDFGVEGIILGSLIFGYISMRIYRNFKLYRDFKSLVIYLVLIQFMIFSMARIYTSLTTRALIFVWVIFFFKRSKTGGITLSREKGSV